MGSKPYSIHNDRVDKVNEPIGPISLLPDILAPSLDVIFVGAAPSPTAARIGHYYAGRGNRFWTLLHQAGFTPRLLDATEDHQVLQYGIGLTAVFRDRISTMNSLLPTPSRDEIADLERRIIACAPRFVCYNGKDVCRMCTGMSNPLWGEMSEPIGGSRRYVVPSSSGRADRWGMERLQLFIELRELVHAGGSSDK